MERDVVAPERKIKVPIPAAPMNRDLRQSTGYCGIFPQSHGIEAPRFTKKRICIYHLNSSRAASCGEFKFKILLKNKHFGSPQKNVESATNHGGAEFQPAGIPRYVEDLKRGTNTEIGPKDYFETMNRIDLKIEILVQGQGGAEFQPAGIPRYVEDLKRGTNAEIGPKDYFETILRLSQGTCPPLQVEKELQAFLNFLREYLG